MSPSLEEEFRRAERHLARAVAAEAELDALRTKIRALAVEWRGRGYGMYERCADEVTDVLDGGGEDPTPQWQHDNEEGVRDE